METYSDSDKTTSNAICSNIQCEQSCFYCNEKDIKKLNLCEICRCVYYCSKDHQNIHLAGRFMQVEYNASENGESDGYVDENNICIENPSDFRAIHDIQFNQTQCKLKFECFPFKVAHDKLKGRHLIASRDIEPGEVILVDQPFVQGPPSKSFPVCLQCGKLPSQKLYHCSRCRLPVCNKICEQGDIHKLECDVYSSVIDYYNDKVAQKNNEDPNKEEEYNDNENKIKDVEQLLKTFEISKFDSHCPTYTSITPLRILLRFRQDMTQQTMKIQNGEKTKEEVDSTWYRVMQLMDHEEERRKDQKAWMMNHILVVVYLQRLLAIANKVNNQQFPQFSAKQIHKAIGIMRTNGVKVDGKTKSHSSMVALYPTYSLTNHSCIDCNTRTVKTENSKNEYILKIRASIAIKRGEEIYTRYTPPQLMSLRRQFVLQSQWYFSCECRRCQDPTECDTMGNAIVCSFNHDEDDNNNIPHFMLPKDPRYLDSEWICATNVSHVQKAAHTKELVAEIEDSIKLLEKEKKPIDMLEEILNRYSGIKLHQNHLLLINVREKIIQALIRRRQGLKAVLSQKGNEMTHGQKKRIEEESVNNLKKQIVHFRSVKKVMEKLDFPKEFWVESLQKMEHEEERLCENEHV